MKKQILTMGLAVMASVASAASPAFTTAAERVDSLMRCLFHDGGGAGRLADALPFPRWRAGGGCRGGEKR
ncbi:MAG: hypothetical protein ACLVJI_04615 [Bacilli bacterium]